VMQLAAEIGQGLGVARFRPEGACDPLTLDRSAAGMENQEGDELLLSRAWWTGGGTAIGENTEASKQLDAQNGRNSHGSRLHRLRSARRACGRVGSSAEHARAARPSYGVSAAACCHSTRHSTRTTLTVTGLAKGPFWFRCWVTHIVSPSSL